MSTVTVESALLRRFITVHEEAVARVETLTSGMSAEAGSWKPSEKAWSVAKCLEHLNESMGTYAEKMRPAIEKARREGKTGTEPYGKGTWIGRYLVGFLRKGPDEKKAPAPGTFQPKSSDLDLAAVVERFRTRVRTMIALAEEADGLRLGDVVFGTPVSPLVRLSLAQAFEVHVHHTPRHLDQAERVIRMDGFPG